MTPTPYRFVIGGLLFAMYAAFGLSWIAITPLMGDLQAHFGVSAAQMGLITTMVAVAKVIAPLLTGVLAVKIGPSRTILLGGAFIACAALAPLAPDFNWFVASRFVFGIGGAIVVTLMGPMAMQWFPPAERPMVTAFNNVAVNTGITITLFATVPLAASLGWKGVLTAYGLASVALMLAWAVLGRDVPVAAPVAGEAVDRPKATYAEVWAMPETWLVAIAFAGPLALYLAFNTFLPKYYMEAFAMTKIQASQLTGLFNLVGIPTALTFGYLTQRAGVRRPFLIGAGLLMCVSSFGMILATDPTLRIAAAVGLGIALFAYVAPLFTIPMELPNATPERVALMMGTIFSVAYTAGSLSPVVTGSIHDAYGSYMPGLCIWAVGSLVLAIAGWLLPETGPKHRVSAETSKLGVAQAASEESKALALERRGVA